MKPPYFMMIKSNLVIIKSYLLMIKSNLLIIYEKYK